MTCETCQASITRVQRGALSGSEDGLGQMCCPGTNTPHTPKRER